jgi:hypothetical protein
VTMIETCTAIDYLMQTYCNSAYYSEYYISGGLSLVRRMGQGGKPSVVVVLDSGGSSCKLGIAGTPGSLMYV